MNIGTLSSLFISFKSEIQKPKNLAGLAVLALAASVFSKNTTLQRKGKALFGRIQQNPIKTCFVTLIGVTLFSRLYPSKSGEGPTICPTVKIKKGTEISRTDNRLDRRGPIDLIKDVHEISMDGQKGLLMLDEDYETISRICKEAAFEKNFKKLTPGDLQKNSELIKKSRFATDGSETLFFLWQIPEYLKEFDNYIYNRAESFLESEDEDSNYSLQSSNEISTENPSITIHSSIFSVIQRETYTEISVEFFDPKKSFISDDSQSVCYFRNLRNEFIPAISTEFFFSDSSNPNSEEIDKLRTFMQDIKVLGFGAYLCNDQRNVVIGAYAEEILSPGSLAILFSQEPHIKSRFTDALKTAAIQSNYEGESMVSKADIWMENFLHRFLLAYW